jgi:hypothetical protein
MMCDTCKVRPAECGSAFCKSCGRWEVLTDCFGVAGALLLLCGLALAVRMCGG